MFVTTSPQALPGTCIMCPRSVREAFIDTELQIEWHGAVIICNLCVIQMGRLFGMATQEDVDRLKINIDRCHDTIYELERQLAGLEQIRNGMATLGIVVPHGSDVLAVPSSDGARVDGSAQSDDGLSDRVSSGQGGDVGTQGGASSEPLHDEGLAELHSSHVSDGVLHI